MSALSVYFLPSDFAPAAVAGGQVVIVDILRASTTITYALAAGAARVRPCLTIEDAVKVQQDAAADLDPETGSTSAWLLGGERGGVLIDGFDFGNSPASYTSAAIDGRPLAFTTTNGTKALLHCRQADQIWIGCFANLSAVVRALSGSSRPIHIVCAGTDGQVTGEDVLFAGALVAALCEPGDNPDYSPTDAAQIALAFWQEAIAGEGPGRLPDRLRESQGGRNLLRLGYDSDIHTAAQIDTHDVVGHLRADGCLYAVPDSAG